MALLCAGLGGLVGLVGLVGCQGSFQGGCQGGKKRARPKLSYPAEMIPALYNSVVLFVSADGRYVVGRPNTESVSLLLDRRTGRVSRHDGDPIGPPTQDGTLCLLKKTGRNTPTVVDSLGVVRKLPDLSDTLTGTFTGAETRAETEAWTRVARAVATAGCRRLVLDVRRLSGGEPSGRGRYPAGKNSEIVGVDAAGAVRWRHREYRRTIWSLSHWENGLAFSPNGNRLAYTVYNGIVVLDADSGNEIYRYQHPSLQLDIVRFSGDGRTILALGGSRFWEIQPSGHQAPEPIELRERYQDFAEGKPGRVVLLQEGKTHGSQLAMPSWLCSLTELRVHQRTRSTFWKHTGYGCLRTLARLPDGRILLPSRQ